MRAVVVMLVVGGGVAAADDTAPEPPADPNRPPGFTLIERLDGNSWAGGDITYLVLDGDADTPVMRLSLHGRYVHPRRRLGGYVELPLAIETGSGDDTAGIGNLEVGGLFLPRFTSTDFGMTVRLGLTLPTGNEDRSGLLNLLATQVRPDDLYLALPHATSLRFGASPTWRFGRMYGKLAIGVDVNIDQSGPTDADTVFRLGFGIGADFDSVAITAEFANLFPTNDDADALSVGALGARFATGALRPYAALLVPLEDDTQAVYQVAITGGLEVALP
jgi:hypothetical protein